MENYDRLSEHPHKYGIITKTGTKEAAWVKDYKEYLIVQGQADDLTRMLSEQRGSLDPLLREMSEEFNEKGNLTQVNIVKLLERARSYRELMDQMAFFFKTSFNQLGMAQTNTSRLLKEFEEESRESRRMMNEKEDVMAESINDLKEEIRRLREISERKEEEAALRREKKLKKNKRPLRDSFLFEDLKMILKDIGTKDGSNNTATARDRVCILLLYILGIRVAELKELTLADVMAFYEGKIVEITIGKSNSPIKQQLVPSEEKNSEKYDKKISVRRH